jgi:fructokinase
MTLLGGIEAGGTKVVCAVATDPQTIIAQTRIETTTPAATIAEALAFFQRVTAGSTLSALGIASFGPLQLSPDEADWGSILATPKYGWSHVDLAGSFARGLGVPVAFETDVNSAALGEARYGAGRGVRNLAYVTVGTGIGAGIITEGRVLRGRRHTEIGHIRPRRHKFDLDFAGCCPFHGDCLEGLASGAAILRRCGAPLHQLPEDHLMWVIEADYLAQLCGMLALTVAPDRIIMGGGVMQAEGLREAIKAPLLAYLADYPSGIAAEISTSDLVTAPGLGGGSGVVGALSMAADIVAAGQIAPRAVPAISCRAHSPSGTGQ